MMGQSMWPLPEKDLMQQHSNAPNLSLLVVVLLQHYLRNQEIFFAIALLFSLVQHHRQPKVYKLINPVPIHHVPRLKILMESASLLMHVLNPFFLTFRAEMMLFKILTACDSLICLDLFFKISSANDPKLQYSNTTTLHSLFSKIS